MRAIEQALEAEKFANLVREQAPMLDADTIALCHPIDYIDAIRDASPDEGLIGLDGDTSMSPGSFEAALRCAGGAVLAVDEVVTGKVSNAFVGTRPPGHHAETARPMGFCIFNNVAIAARHAQKKHGLQRVAIMDFDVHHGNGSQEIFWSDPTVMYTSTHQMPLYPGTGARSERGDHDNIVNAPLSSGDGGKQFREAMDSVILPRIDNFGPDLIIISAGFDAHRDDPLGGLAFVEDDFAWATGKLMDLAGKRAQGRLVSVLEGGYDLDGLANSTAAHVSRLMG
jgi:acetoin utilization deacetylase AcuC-like enzyme